MCGAHTYTQAHTQAHKVDIKKGFCLMIHVVLLWYKLLRVNPETISSLWECMCR